MCRSMILLRSILNVYFIRYAYLQQYLLSNKHKRPHTHCTHGTCGVLHCLLFCDQTRPNLRISLVGYHCSIEFPCGVPLFYCCKYPTTYGVRVHPHTQSCFTYTVWTFFCSRVLKKVKFFKPLPLPLKIVFGADFVSIFPLNVLLHFETDNTKPVKALCGRV